MMPSFLYQNAIKLSSDETATLFVNKIYRSSPKFTELQFNEDDTMMDIFKKVNSNIASGYYTVRDNDASA